MCDKFCRLQQRMEILGLFSCSPSIDMRNGGQLWKAIDAALSDRNASELILGKQLFRSDAKEIQFMPSLLRRDVDGAPIGEIVLAFKMNLSCF